MSKKLPNTKIQKKKNKFQHWKYIFIHKKTWQLIVSKCNNYFTSSNTNYHENILGKLFTHQIKTINGQVIILKINVKSSNAALGALLRFPTLNTEVFALLVHEKMWIVYNSQIKIIIIIVVKNYIYKSINWKILEAGPEKTNIKFWDELQWKKSQILLE